MSAARPRAEVPSLGSGASSELGWTLCVCTYNRPDILLQCLKQALAQTRPPREVIVIDASPNWEASRTASEALMEARPKVPLVYLPAPTRSLTRQRNLAVTCAGSDILFLIDDDSLMFEDCAEMVMGVYEADRDGAVVGVQISPTRENPVAGLVPVTRKITGHDGFGGAGRRLLSFGPMRWFYRRILMMSVSESFIRYDPQPRTDAPLPASVSGLGAVPIEFMVGHSMTCRRWVAEREPFEEALLYYAASEDLDASYRFSRHGRLALAPTARLHHYQAASGRLGRDQVIKLQLLNLALFIRRHSAVWERKRGEYRVSLLRRLLGEFLKDLLAGRLRFPQVSGVLFAMRHHNAVFARSDAEIVEWYQELQRKIVQE